MIKLFKFILKKIFVFFHYNFFFFFFKGGSRKRLPKQDNYNEDSTNRFQVSEKEVQV